MCADLAVYAPVLTAIDAVYDRMSRLQRCVHSRRGVLRLVGAEVTVTVGPDAHPMTSRLARGVFRSDSALGRPRIVDT